MIMFQSSQNVLFVNHQSKVSRNPVFEDKCRNDHMHPLMMNLWCVNQVSSPEKVMQRVKSVNLNKLLLRRSPSFRLDQLESRVIKVLPRRDVESEMEPIIPPRPTRVSSIKSIPEKEPEAEVEPTIPPRPTRVSSIKSILVTTTEGLKLNWIRHHSYRQDQRGKSSVKSTPEITTPEAVPIIPQRPTRKSSVKSFRSQHSIEEESDPTMVVHQPVEPSVDIPAIPQRPKKVEHKHIEHEETALSIEEVPTSPHQHPVIPARPTKVEHKHVEPEDAALSIEEVALLSVNIQSSQYDRLKWNINT